MTTSAITLNGGSRIQPAAFWIAVALTYGLSALALSALLGSMSVAVIMLGVVALAGGFYTAWRWPAAVVIAILVLVPFQPLPTMMAQAGGITPILLASSMKEVLMAVAVIAAAGHWRKRLSAVDVVLLILVGLALVHRLFGGTWIGIKDDFDFALPFAAGRVIQLSQEGRVLWVKLALASMSVVAILGLLEFHFVPAELRVLWMGLQQIPTQYHATGYEGGRIGSTLNGPAEFGMMCTFALVLFAAFRDRLARRWWFAVPVLSAGVLLSVTRSAWIAAALGLVAVELRRGHRLRTGVLLAAAMTAALLAAQLLGLSDFLAATSSREDVSLQGHVESLAEYTAAVWEHPLGTGPGTVGPRALERSSTAVNPESSYLAIAVAYGILGGLLFVAFCALGLWYCYRLSSQLSIAALGMLLGYAASMFVLPNYMSFCMGSWVWFAVGMVVSDKFCVRRRESTIEGASNL
jgi:O-antigen ligase